MARIDSKYGNIDWDYKTRTVKYEHNGQEFTVALPEGGIRGSYSDTNIRHLVSMYKYYQDNGVYPDTEIMKSKEFNERYGSYDDNLMDWTDRGGLKKVFEETQDSISSTNISNPNQSTPNQNNGQTPSQSPTSQLDPYYQAMFDRNNPDSVLNSLYETFRDQGTIDYQSSQTELQRAERDLEMANASNRLQLMDQIRSDRRSKLKSGLSSAQIANDEIQSQLIAQNMANQNSQQFYNTRMQNNAQYASNDQNALLQAYNMFNSQNLGPIMGTQYATYASDPIQFGQRYGGLSPQAKANLEKTMFPKS